MASRLARTTSVISNLDVATELYYVNVAILDGAGRPLE